MARLGLFSSLTESNKANRVEKRDTINKKKNKVDHIKRGGLQETRKHENKQLRLTLHLEKI
jgi:hypothetical protein